MISEAYNKTKVHNVFIYLFVILKKKKKKREAQTFFLLWSLIVTGNQGSCLTATHKPQMEVFSKNTTPYGLRWFLKNVFIYLFYRYIQRRIEKLQVGTQWYQVGDHLYDM